MAIQRFYYVTQESLVVWSFAGNSLAAEVTFENSDSGFRHFSSYLEKSPVLRALMVVDVIEEEFDTDSLPKVSGSDRKSLIERRLKKRFSRTPYRNGVFLGGRRRRSDDFNVVFSAITNHELIEPWLEVLAQQKSPLVGVTSIPLISMDLLRQFEKPAENSLFLTEHQGGRLRMVFAKGGQPVSARLSRVSHSSVEEHGRSLVSEIVQSRNFLERSRMMGADSTLNIYIVAEDDSIANYFSEVDRQRNKVRSIPLAEAAKAVGLAELPSSVNMEAIYLGLCRRKKPSRHYELKGTTNYSQHLRIRSFAIGTAVAGAVACSIGAGVLLSGALVFRGATAQIESQIEMLEETYRRENAEFQPVRADSHEMKLAVDIGDYISQNTLAVDWVMRQIGLVMDDHDDMRIGNLSWKIESVADPNAGDQSRRNDPARPVPIPAAAGVTAKLSGEIRPYDGNLRNAFRKIDQLANHIQQQTAFENVAVTEYPIDANPAVALSGEVRRKNDNVVANFSLRLTLRVANETR